MTYIGKAILHKGILGIAAVALSFSAAQLASGQDLTVGLRSAGAPDQGINRAAKTDRSPVVAEPVVRTQTIAFKVDRLPETSILVRIPLNHESRTSSPAPAVTPPQLKGEHKVKVACEPVVSVLTEIAKRLQPGRCLA
jgi:hypothetical protein